MASDLFGDGRIILDPERARLTKRQMEVAKEVARGKNNKRIGKALKIKETTVCTHIRNINNKTSLQNRVELVIYVFYYGLLSCDLRESA